MTTQYLAQWAKLSPPEQQKVAKSFLENYAQLPHAELGEQIEKMVQLTTLTGAATAIICARAARTLLSHKIILKVIVSCMITMFSNDLALRCVIVGHERENGNLGAAHISVEAVHGRCRCAFAAIRPHRLMFRRFRGQPIVSRYVATRSSHFFREDDQEDIQDGR